MLDFTAIDFETANSYRSSACSVGLARVRDGEIVAVEHWLMRPPEGIDHFDWFNTKLHGIDAAMVADQPRFVDRLPELIEFIGDDALVAHNAAFDSGVLRDACAWSQVEVPDIRSIYCTLVLARRALSLPSYQLPAVAGHLGVPLDDHHRADADAVASARIAIALAEQHEVDDLPQLARHLSVVPGYMGPDGWQGAHRRSGGGSSSLQITPSNISADQDGYLYDRVIVFTGTLPAGVSRQMAFDAAAEVGAIVEKGVTKRTNVLVVGDLNPAHLAPGQELSGKARKAADLQAKGQDIEVLSGDEFLRLVPAVQPAPMAPPPRKDPRPLHRAARPTTQTCSEPDCEQQALFGTRTRPTWCNDHMDVLLSKLGLVACEEFVSPDSYRLCRCAYCGFEGHYRLPLLLDRLAYGAGGCEACKWRAWAADYRAQWPVDLPPPAGEDDPDVPTLADRNGFDYLGPLGDPSRWGDPHALRCRDCGKLSATRVRDISYGCACTK